MVVSTQTRISPGVRLPPQAIGNGVQHARLGAQHAVGINSASSTPVDTIRQPLIQLRQITGQALGGRLLFNSSGIRRHAQSRKVFAVVLLLEAVDEQALLQCDAAADIGADLQVAAQRCTGTEPLSVK